MQSFVLYTQAKFVGQSKAVKTRPEILEMVMCLLQHQNAPSTEAKYRTGQGHFFAFATACGMPVDSFFPVKEWDIMCFVGYLAVWGNLKADTIRGYVSHVYAAHCQLGYGSYYKDFSRLRQLLKGLKRALRQTPTALRLPITVSVLRKFREQLKLALPDDAMVWSACCIAFYCLLRFGEIAVHTLSYDGPRLPRWRQIRMERH